MNPKRKSPGRTGLDQTAVISTRQSTASKGIKSVKEGKLSRMLNLFANGAILHRFQAAAVGDSCVNSTTSDIQRRHGIHFSKKLVRVVNRFGTYSSVMQYWLEGENLLKARKLLGLDEVGA